MKPAFVTVKKHHYTSDIAHESYVDANHLYAEIGVDYKQLVKENYAYTNTCATRLSLALIKSGLPVGGRLRIKSGTYAGRTIEPGSKLLADQLSLPTMLGKPEIYAAKDASAKISKRKGVVFFWKIGGFNVSHIDLIETVNKAQVCHSLCSFDSKEVWFWELP